MAFLGLEIRQRNIINELNSSVFPGLLQILDFFFLLVISSLQVASVNLNRFADLPTWRLLHSDEFVGEEQMLVLFLGLRIRPFFGFSVVKRDFLSDVLTVSQNCQPISLTKLSSIYIYLIEVFPLYLTIIISLSLLSGDAYLPCFSFTLVIIS